MTMIALGGVIGAGLFVGSSLVIKSAGPGAVISFLITGLLVVLVMKMLGEMAVALPGVGSFYEFIRFTLGDMAGFLTGWMYWYFWVIVIGLEAIAGAQLLRFWLPDMPLWIGSLSIVVLLTLCNLLSVRTYGEAEFWFASVKVAAIVVFLFLGVLFALGLWPTPTPGFHNLVANGGFAPNGYLPILTGAVAATGFYFGAELVTVAAAEAAEPAKAIAKATNSVISRVLIFYVGSILLIVAIVPWNTAEIATPYVSALKMMGVPAAAQIMNAVILTAVLSALNSGLYASSRILFALTKAGDAPSALARVSRNGVPVRAILLGTVFGYGAIIMSYISPDRVFAFLVNSYGTVALFVYLLIALAHLRLRARLARDPSGAVAPMRWGYPYLTYGAIIAMIGILAGMAFIPDQRLPLMMGVASLAAIALGYVGKRLSFSRPATPLTPPVGSPP